MTYASIMVNNYVLGAKVKTMPVHKIIKQTRVDSNHTAIFFEDVTEREIELIRKLMGRYNRVNVYQK